MTPAELDIVIKANVNAGLQGLASINTKLDQTKVSAAGATDAVTKTAVGINNITTVSVKAGNALSQQASSIASVGDAALEAASNASKLSDVIGSGSDEIITSNTAIAKSYDDIEASVNSFADAFNQKWNPIVDEAQKAAGVFEQIPQSLAGLNQGFTTTDLSKDLAGSAIAASSLDSALDQLVQQTATFLRLDESVKILLLSISDLSPELRQFAQDGQGSIAQLTAAFNLLKDKATFTTDPQQLLNYNLAIEQLGKQINNAKTAASNFTPALGKINPAANTANFAVTNLGRVLQDLPFGFIGIANNLNPLLESFQRLQKESKDTGTSLISNLGAALTGGGGIGLALSAVTAALTLASFGFSAWTRGFGNATQKAEEHAQVIEVLKTNYDHFTEQLNKTIEAASQESSKVNILFSALGDANISLDKRKGLIEQLNQASPAYLGNLDKEKSSYADIAKAVDNFNNSLAKNAVIKALLPDFEKIVKPLLDAQSELFKFQSGVSPLKFFLSDEDAATEEKRLQDAVDKQHKIVLQAQKGFETIAGGAKSLEEILFGKTETTGKTKSAADEIAKVLEKLAIDRDVLSKNPLVFALDKPLKDIELLQSAIQRLRELKAPEPIIIKIQTEIDNEALSAVGGQLQKQFGDLKNLKLPDIEFPTIKAPLQFVVPNEETQFAILKEQVRSLSEKLQITLPVNFDALNKEELKAILDAIPSDVKIKLGITGDQTGFKEFIKNLTDSQNAIDKLNTSIANTTLDTITNAFADFGKAIGTQGNPFAALFKVFSQGLESLGKSLIEYGVEVGIIQKIFANPLNPISPALAIGAGIALEALASLLQSKVSHFAEGGIVTAPILGLIGERGKEVVIPLDRIHEVLNLDNGNSVFIAENRISGQDIVTAFKRADKHNRRTY